MSSSYIKNDSVNSANSRSAALLASYLAECKRFIAHFRYIACDQPERVFFKLEARALMSEDRL
jgi:hypothetical protein